MSNPPDFVLFRLTKPMDNGCTHAGHVWINRRQWTFTCKVVETSYGKQFHGSVEAPGEAIRKKLEASPPQDDLVSQASQPSPEPPFNDPLPPF